jgi:hypothetical protein
LATISPSGNKKPKPPRIERKVTQERIEEIKKLKELENNPIIKVLKKAKPL